MTAREEWKAAEERVAACEARIAATHAYEAWCVTDCRKEPPPGEPGDLATLLLERERLQQESFRLWQRMRAEVTG